MATNEQIKNIDTIITYLLIKKLVTPIVKTKAFKIGLINSTGKIIKDPTPEEEINLTVLDKLVLKLKRLVGTKLLTLNNFLYLQNTNNNMYDKLFVKGSITQRAEIKRIVKDIKTFQEDNNLQIDQIVYSLLSEDLENSEGLLNEENSEI